MTAAAFPRIECARIDTWSWDIPMNIREFKTQLRGGRLSVPAVPLLAWVSDDDDDDHIRVAAPGDCSQWRVVPTSVVRSAKPVAETACGGHTHVVVELQFEPIAELEPVHRTLVDLLRRDLRGLQSFDRPRTAAGHCVTHCMGNTLWCVCDDGFGNQHAEPCGTCGGAQNLSAFEPMSPLRDPRFTNPGRRFLPR